MSCSDVIKHGLGWLDWAHAGTLVLSSYAACCNIFWRPVAKRRRKANANNQPENLSTANLAIADHRSNVVKNVKQRPFWEEEEKSFVSVIDIEGGEVRIAHWVSLAIPMFDWSHLKGLDYGLMVWSDVFFAFVFHCVLVSLWLVSCGMTYISSMYDWLHLKGFDYGWMVWSDGSWLQPDLPLSQYCSVPMELFNATMKF